MERTKMAINKLFVVVALVLTIALCCALFGCGEKMKDATSNQDTSPIVTEPENKPNDEEYDPDNVILVPPSIPSTGAHLSIDVDEVNEYDIGDSAIDVLYGIDINTFNGYWGSFKDDNEEYMTDKICVMAYDMSIYSDKLNSRNDENALYENLIDLEVGDARNGVFLIDEIPYTAEMRATETNPQDVHQCLNVENIIGTKYECRTEFTQMNYEVVYNVQNSVNLPRDLFVGDSGNIMFGIVLLMKSDKSNVYVKEISSYEFRAQVKYDKRDEQIVFSDVRSGEKYSVNNSGIKFKSKSFSNVNI